MTAIPAPSRDGRRDDQRLGGGQPDPQGTDGGGDRAGDGHRQGPSPVDGATGQRQDDQRGHRQQGEHRTGSARAEIPHLRHIDVQIRNGEAAPERTQRVPSWIRRNAAPIAVVTLTYLGQVIKRI